MVTKHQNAGEDTAQQITHRRKRYQQGGRRLSQQLPYLPRVHKIGVAGNHFAFPIQREILLPVLLLQEYMSMTVLCRPGSLKVKF